MRVVYLEPKQSIIQYKGLLHKTTKDSFPKIKINKKQNKKKQKILFRFGRINIKKFVHFTIIVLLFFEKSRSTMWVFYKLSVASA